MCCYTYTKWLKLLGGLGLMYSSYLANAGNVVFFDPWFVLGAMFFLMGVAKFVCKDECCYYEMPKKKK